MDTVVVDGENLSIEDICAVAKFAADVKFPDDGQILDCVDKSRIFLESYIKQGFPIYGVTTGFGDSCNCQINPSFADELQQVIVRYHGIGVGKNFSEEEGRAVVLCRLNSNVKGGFSGIRKKLALIFADFLNKGITPVIPEIGSVGASGDLTPLSYLAAAIQGERNVYYNGKIVCAKDALAAEGIEPISLAAKEGLAIMNGTSVMTAVAALAWKNAERIADICDFITAATVEITGGNEVPFRRKVSEVKNHAGQIKSAEYIYKVLEDSKRCIKYEDLLEEIGSIGLNEFERLSVKIQNRYSLRCAPQINGVLRDTLSFTKNWIEEEVNSANDNPLIDWENEKIFNTGNFYGGHICAACDYLRLALANISDLADKQAELIIDGKFNGLTENLIPNDGKRQGLRFGFKAAQITISALRSEIMHCSSAVSIHSSPTEALNQDKVSLGTISARKLREQIDLIYMQFAVHVLAIAQAVDLAGKEFFSSKTKMLHEEIRKMSCFVSEDRALDMDVKTVTEWLKSTEFFNLQ